MNWLLVIAGAAVGAPIRYLVGEAMKARFGKAYPWGTFVVNVVGSFLLGWVSRLSSPEVGLLLGVGFCGALTTYSTFSYEALTLSQSGHGWRAAVYVVSSVVAGLLAVWAGVSI